nr:MAG TPA: TUP1-like enhancer of split [Caudoviricetes sp.]
MMDDPNPDWLGPYIRHALRDGFTIELREVCDGSREVTEC